MWGREVGGVLVSSVCPELLSVTSGETDTQATSVINHQKYRGAEDNFSQKYTFSFQILHHYNDYFEKYEKKVFDWVGDADCWVIREIICQTKSWANLILGNIISLCLAFDKPDYLSYFIFTLILLFLQLLLYNSCQNFFEQFQQDSGKNFILQGMKWKQEIYNGENVNCSQEQFKIYQNKYSWLVWRYRTKIPLTCPSHCVTVSVY